MTSTATDFYCDVYVTGSTNLTGALNANNNLSVSGRTTLNNNLTIARQTTINNMLFVNNNVELTGVLNYTGTSSFYIKTIKTK